ncbi:MAG: YdcF family protein [Deltaproteobacteria bacterium]|nr:YdcF family protein [Deltaproteobacteria bacterium]
MRVSSVVVLGAVLVLGCGGDGGGGGQPDMATDGSAPDARVAGDANEPSIDAFAPRDATPDANRVTSDATAPDEDAALDMSSARTDAMAADAGPATDPVTECPVPSMVDQYPGLFPPNPYGAWETASACIHAGHDAIVVLGCPSEADGSPSRCQTTRADFAVALSSAGLGNRFIVTGAAVANEHVEAESLRSLLIARGVADSDIVLEPLAEHTDENLYYSSRIMQDRGWQSAVVVSDDAGHLVFTGLCDANCCVQLGRMTVLDFEVPGRAPIRAGHYVLDPFGPRVEPAECEHIGSPTKALCLNRAMRRACADDFRL